MPNQDHHQPAPLLGKSSGSASPSKSKRQPAGEIVYLPVATSPKDWTRKDKNAVSGAVGMGIVFGLIVWSMLVGVLFFALSVLSYSPSY